MVRSGIHLALAQAAGSCMKNADGEHGTLVMGLLYTMTLLGHGVGMEQ